VAVTADSTGFLVKPEIACQQLDAEAPRPGVPVPGRPTGGGAGTVDGLPPKGGRDQSEPVPAVRRFFGTVTLDPTRVGRDAGRIAEEVISHLVGQIGADVTVRLEIAADLPKGASDQVVRTVTENSRTLKFDTHGFERE
jgi:hypothetical protein